MDHISLLAARDGYLSWEIIWKNNAALAATRKNPNILFKGVKFSPDGDVLQLPAITPKTDTAPTETKNPYVVPTTKLFLRIRMLNEDFTAMVNAKFRLAVGTMTPKEGTTGGLGEIEEEIPWTAQEGTLQVTPAGALPPVPPPAGGPGTPPAAGAATPADQNLAATPLLFNLRIGALNPILETTPDSNISGVQQRLNNLGFDAGDVDGQLLVGSSTERALKLFQKTFGLPETGRADPATLAKLKIVHDAPDSIVPIVLPPGVAPLPSQPPGPVPGPAPAGTPPPSAARPSAGHDIGHVAPDFSIVDGGRIHFNTLRYQPVYRISMSFIEDFDLFFPDVITSDRGRMARLQALTYFRLPINDTNAATCLTESWTYFKNHAQSGAVLSDTAPASPPGALSPAHKKLKDMLQSEVLEGGKLPEPGTPAKFGKIFLPGSYTFFNPSSPFELGANRYQSEGAYLTANEFLHKLPIKVKVEKLFRDGTWVPAPRAWVYFQLVKPADIPAAQAAPDARATQQAPSTRSPKTYIDTTRSADAVAANDPQVDNAFNTKGGKRGLPVPGNVFEVTTKRKGFHIAPDGTGRVLGHDDYNAAEDGTGVIPHSVRALTNDQGETGVIFMPARCGGDRYKIRAFVGPGTLASDGKERRSTDPKVSKTHVTESGTMVVWRVLRIAESLRIPIPATVNMTLANELFNYSQGMGVGQPDPAPTPNPNPAQTQQNYRNYLWEMLGLRMRAAPNTESLLGTVQLNTADFFSQEFKKAWVEVRIDNRTERDMTLAEWQGAFNKALTEAKANGPARNRYNIDKLIYFDPNAPFLFGMHTPTAYNASLTVAENATKAMGDPPTPAESPDINDLVRKRMFDHMLRFFSKDGMIPALTIIRAPLGEVFGFLALPGGFGSSGVARPPNGCYVFYGYHLYLRNAGTGIIFPGYQLAAAPVDTLQCNTVHEAGHCHYCRHERFGGASESASADTTHDMQNRCIMSYEAQSFGEFCGKCLLGLRGYDIQSFT